MQSLNLKITAEFYVDLCFLRAGMARAEDDDNEDGPSPYPECDAYGENEKAVRAEFYQRAPDDLAGDREVGSIRARATPDGFRQFIRDVRSASRNLKDNGLCPKCPDPAEALMRIPRAKYCAECCVAVAIMGGSVE